MVLVVNTCTTVPVVASISAVASYTSAAAIRLISCPGGFNHCVTPKTNKKTDVVGHPEVIDHIGLLFNEPPVTAGLFFN